MKHIYKISAYLLICAFFSQAGFAQTEATIKSQLSGRVLDAAGKQPLGGAVVRIKGVTNATNTDNEGRFTLVTGQSFPYTLTVSFVGYITQDVIASGSPVEIILKENLNQLNAVVVTGYSTQERKYIAGSITSVKGDAIKDQPVAAFNQLLQGKATGVQVLSNSGVPGGGITFRVRGNNSINASVDPLYIVDGVFLNNNDPVTSLGNQSGSNPIADLNVNDIESIQILKDANATAIYGSLGAKGVIIVTTKRGKRNTKGKINFNTYQGWSSAIKKYQVTDGPQTALLANESRINTAAQNGVPPAGLIANPESLPTYNRTDDLFRTALSQNYDLSAQGGTESSDYYVAVGYLNQQSIVKPSDYTRYTARLNYDHNITSKLKVGTSVNISRSDRNLSGSDRSFFTAPFLTTESVFELTFSTNDRNTFWSTWYPSSAGGSFTLKPSDALVAKLNNPLTGGARNTLIAGTSPNSYGVLYNTTATSIDPSYVIRIAELYLIRAEARAQQGKLTGLNSAASDLNIIRDRAGLAPATAVTQTDLLQAIEDENSVEFAFEAHRWFDLTRTGRTGAVLGITNPNRYLFPIPLSDILSDPDVTQNPRLLTFF